MNMKRKRTRRKALLRELVLQRRIKAAQSNEQERVLRLHLKTVRRRLQGVYRAP